MTQLVYTNLPWGPQWPLIFLENVSLLAVHLFKYAVHAGFQNRHRSTTHSRSQGFPAIESS